jgi:phosphoglycerol transferase MdoB-like AlkP superfamily enzyme
MKNFLSQMKSLKSNPFAWIVLVALIIQTVMLVLFYSLPDPLGLSLTEMFEGKIIWQVFMAFGAILVMGALFAFARAPRALAIFFAFYFFVAVVDYDLFRFSHQRLSYSFLRTYFHISNITDATTVTTLGGDLLGTVLWITLVLACFAGVAVFVTLYTLRLRRNRASLSSVRSDAPGKPSKKLPVTMLVVGLALSVTPLVLFLTGARGWIEVPLVHFKIEKRFTLGKHTLTAPILHIAAVETFEFIHDNTKITDDLVDDLDSFLPSDFVASRPDLAAFPLYRGAPTHEYKAKKRYNIVFIMGESFKGRFFNQMLEGDTALAPNIWKLASGAYFAKDSSGNALGGGLWFKNAFSGGYPTVRGTMATYMGFPSHPNRDVPSFYAANKFKGFPEFLTDYHRSYMTVSNPIFDHTLPFVEKFFGKNWYLPEEEQIAGSADSLGVNAAIKALSEKPVDSPWLLAFNTIASHIPFYNYPDQFAEKPADDAVARYRNALRYTDAQLGRFFDSLAARPDFENTVVFVLGDHDTPVDSIDYKVPQPLGVATTQIFIGLFSPDTALFNGLDVREDVASQLDLGPTIFDLAGVREPNHFWGYDLLVQERPAGQPSVFFSQNSYYLGFRDHVLVGGLENEEVYSGVDGVFTQVQDSVSLGWKKKAVGTAKALRSVLRNDIMMP